MRAIAFFCATLAVAILALTARPAPALNREAAHRRASSSLDAEILEELNRYYADLSARDWTKFASHFWPGATITTIWQPEGEARPRVYVQSIPEFIAQAPRGPGSKPIFEEKMAGAEVKGLSSLAQAWARYEARFGEPGKVEQWSGTDAFTLMKHEGRWRIVSLAFAAER